MVKNKEFKDGSVVKVITDPRIKSNRANFKVLDSMALQESFILPELTS